MIIRAENGEKLQLTKDKLTEIGHQDTSYPFHTTKLLLKQAIKEDDGYITVIGHTSNGGPHTTDVRFEPTTGIIGCKTFTPEVYRKILSTMGLLPKKAKAKKKR